jgi:toluene monooxygenase system protein E
MAPSSSITNCAAFGAADLLRRVSIVAYRTRELSRAFPESGIGTHERQRWLGDAAWQGTRRAVELALTAYDWAESFAAVNLVLRPRLDDVLLRQLGLAARDHGDDETWLLASNLALDSERCRKWSAALAKFAIERRPENAAVLARWISVWTPRADDAVTGLAKLMAELPEKPRREGDVREEASQAGKAILRAIGL